MSIERFGGDAASEGGVQEVVGRGGDGMLHLQLV